jgi:hypothetical protein
MTGSDRWEDGVEVVLGEFWAEAWFEHPVVFWTYHFNLVLSVLFLLFMCLFVYLELLLISISLLAVAFYCVFVSVCPHLIFPLPLDMYFPVLCIVLACPVSFPLSLLHHLSSRLSVLLTNPDGSQSQTNERTAHCITSQDISISSTHAHTQAKLSRKQPMHINQSSVRLHCFWHSRLFLHQASSIQPSIDQRIAPGISPPFFLLLPPSVLFLSNNVSSKSRTVNGNISIGLRSFRRPADATMAILWFFSDPFHISLTVLHGHLLDSHHIPSHPERGAESWMRRLG